MMFHGNRRGSALLIVLGMLAFMIVSAVGFAAYMRYARMPSSYLRRTVASRHLVKAALARAIDALDRAVNNNPHPNVGEIFTSDVNYNRNIWQGRVLVGTNCTLNVHACIENDYPSILTLEALAYLPPSLVNSVRIHSRLVPTAQWKSFDFDAGRYAFCVVDVSDFLDVNRLRADVPRSSASNSRISLSYLFEEGLNHEGAGKGSSEWDEFMLKYRGVDEETGELDFASKEPLISVADLNLALGRKGKIGGKIFSPFYETIKNSKDVYSDLGDVETRENIRNMSFITDSLFNASLFKLDSGKETFDLSDSKNQPYAMEDLKKPARLSEMVVTGSLLNNAKWLNALSALGCGALADYLDEDSQPISLAVPTTERIPMICGIRPFFEGSRIMIVKEAPNDVNVEGGDDTYRSVSYTVTYKLNAEEFLKGFDMGHFQSLAVYPFLRGEGDSKRSFTMDGRFSMFFTADVPNLRLLNIKGDFSLEKNIPASELKKDSFNFINVGLSSAPVKIKDSIMTAEDALIKIAEPDKLSVSKGTSMSSALSDFVLLRVEYKWKQTKSKQVSGKEWSPSLSEILEDPKKINGIGDIIAYSDLKILDTATGKISEYSKNELGPEIKTSGITAGPKNIRLNCAVWMRIKEGDKVVDMVPASLLDDKAQNADNAATENFGDIGDMVGRKNPIIPLETDVQFNLTIKDLDELAKNNTPIDIKVSSDALLVSDPRYNYAPEAWFKHTGNGELEVLWPQKNGNPKGKDIFMATSDAGYLQSVYELAFLPRLTNLDADVELGDSAHRGNLPVPKGEAIKGIVAESAEKTWCKDYAWKTYDSIGGDREKFEKLPWKNQGSGFKVNPYSDQTNILMAAYANTPLDWRRASTNMSEVAEKNGIENHTELDAATFNEKYAFNAYSEGGTLEWTDLEAIAGEHMAAVRRDLSKTWHENWDAWWDDNSGDNEDSLCGKELTGEKTKLWDVDKKFLHGFWRDSFAAKQQLYMVFVRAEPMMMGSGSSKHLPPQLGGRAMALVWRDPTPTQKNDTPHRTRVLFYRQFD